MSTTPATPATTSTTDTATTATADGAPAPDTTDTEHTEHTEHTGTGDDDGLAARNAEAARHRVKAREAEAARDALAQRITGYQRRSAEAAIADLLAVPADLWDIGRQDATAFYNDDDELDTAALRAAAAELIRTRPGTAKGAKIPTPQWGQHSGPIPASHGWSNVIGNS